MRGKGKRTVGYNDRHSNELLRSSSTALLTTPPVLPALPPLPVSPRSPHLRVLLGLNGRKERFLLDREGKKSPPNQKKDRAMEEVHQLVAVDTPPQRSFC
jgi:hypothetical protein